MLPHLSLVLCLLSYVDQVICQGSIEDTEGESSTGTWPSNIVCNDQNGNCVKEEINKDDWLEETEPEALEGDNYPDYDWAYDYFIPNDDDVNIEDDEDDDLEEPIEEVEPFSLHTTDDVSDDDTKWKSEFIQEHLQIDGYPIDEDCRQLPDKKRRHSKKADKWEQRRKANIKMKDCCTKGKRVGLRARVYKSDNLFRACREIVRYDMPRMAHRCQWIMQTCCENKALRRYYIHTKGSL